MSEMITVGDAIARTLEQYQVEAIYGVISIHNLPIADAVGQRGNIRFVPARGEAGSVTMADAHGRRHTIVAALLEEEATVKTLRQRDGHTWLMPHNPAFEPINGDHAVIMGTVVAVLRRV